MFEFSLNSPEVLQLRAVQESDDVEQSVRWQISYSRERFVFRGHSTIPVIGTLQASGPAGWGDISVAALLVMLDDAAEDDLEGVIARSDAAETLYDVARGHLMPLLMTVGAVEVLPRKSPPAELVVYGEPNSSEPEDIGLTP